jgi:hypothetical protein
VSALDLLVRLGQRLDLARPTLDRLDAYYAGRQALAFLAPEVRAAVGNRLSPLAVGWPRVVVGALEERLDVEGFRLGAQQPTDDALWALWQANGLDEGSQQAHEEALVHGRAYLMVWAAPDGSPRITVESARQVYVAHSPGSRQRTAAVKRWTEVDGRGHAVVFTPSEVTRLRTVTAIPTDAWGPAYPAPSATFDLPASGWEVVEVLPNPLGVVPVVPLVNRARLLEPDGTSELADVLPLADAINKLATDLLVTSEFYAAPRRWVTGVELPTDEAGEVVEDEAMSATAGRTWMLEAAEARVGQFPEASLDAFVSAVGMFTRQLAALSSLPPHYTDAGGTANPTSADAIRSAEASLVMKARRRQRAFGGAWEEALRLAVLVRDGRPDPRLDRLETVWRNPETPTHAAAADAAAKLAGIGVPLAVLLEGLGYSPEQQARVRELRRAEALDGVLIDPRALTP